MIDESYGLSEKDEMVQIESTEKADLDDIFGDQHDLFDESSKRGKQLKSQSTLLLPHPSTQDKKSTLFSIRAPNFLKFQSDEYNKGLYDHVEEKKLFDTAIAIARWRYKRDDNGDILKDIIYKSIKYTRKIYGKIIKN